MHGCCFPWNSVRTHGRNWAGVSLIEASTSGETDDSTFFPFLSPWIFQNHSPLHPMSVTNSPWNIFWEKPCATEIARFIKIGSWKPTHHPWLKNPMDDRDVELGEVVPGSAKSPLSTSGLLSSNSSRPGTGFTEAERGDMYRFSGMPACRFFL